MRKKQRIMIIADDIDVYNEYLRGNVSIPAELTIFLVIRYLEATTL